MPSASGGVFDVFASGSGSSKKKNKKVADSSDRGKYENSPLNPALSGATTYSTSEDADKPKKDNPADHDWGLTTEDAERRLEKWGYNELPSSRKGKWEMLLDTLLTPMACIIWISIFIEMGVALRLYLLGDTGPTGPMQDFIDMWVLVFLQFFNSFVGWHEEIKAGDAVAELQKSLAPKASVKRNGKWVDLPGRQVVPGDLVCLPLGGAVPADCRLIAGSKPLMIDQASLTGESLPVKFTAGGCAKMGSTVVQGEAEAIVEETGKWTFFGKTASLLNEADNGEDCNLNEKLFYILLFIVFFGIPCVVTVLIVLADRYKEDPHYSVVSNVAVVIVAIVPIANAVVCTSTLAFGSLIMSKEGAIVTRLTSIEEMAGMSMLCSDKTGTLTLNKMVMQTVIANMREIGADTYSSGSSPNKAKRAQNAQKKKNNQNNEEEEGPSDLLKSFVFPEQVSANPEAQDVLKYATLAAKWKETPKDALDTLTINASKARLEEFDGGFKQLDYEPFDPSIKRTSALLEATDGRRFWATKGAPPVVLKLCHNYAEIGDEVEKVIDDLGDRGIRSLAVAISRGEEKKDWVFVGMLTFLDPPRPDTKLTIERAHELGVSVKMITGDQLKIAKETCRSLGMGTACYGTDNLPRSAATATREQKHLIEDADAFAGVFPEHKYMIVQVLQKAGYNCGMTGDGVNDAPALKKADVGIAVQGATDAARAASDIVLTNPGLSPIITAINISRQIFQRIQIYLTYRIIASVMIATFFFISVIIGNLCNYTGCHNCNCYESDLVFDNGTFNDNCLACSYGSTKRENVMCYLTETSTGAVIVDNHEIPIVPYFLLSILQLALMIIFNDGCMVAIAWDRVPGSRFPMKWNLPMLFLRTTLIGLCVATAQIAFLIAGMSALIPEGRLTHNVFYHWFGIKTFLQASELQTLMYASISWAGFLVLMSVRVQGHFWKMFTDATSRPDPLLLGAFLFGTSMTLVIAGTCMSANVDFWAAPWPYLGVAALYNLLAFVMVDTVKVFVNDWIEHRFEGEGNSIGEQRRQVIEVVFEPRTDYDGAAHNAFTAVQEQGLKNQKPYHWQATASGANLLGVSGNPTLPHASNNLLADLSPDRRNRQQADYGSGTQDDGGVGISYSGGNLIHKSGRLATV